MISPLKTASQCCLPDVVLNYKPNKKVTLLHAPLANTDKSEGPTIKLMVTGKELLTLSHRSNWCSRRIRMVSGSH